MYPIADTDSSAGTGSLVIVVYLSVTCQAACLIAFQFVSRFSFIVSLVALPTFSEMKFLSSSHIYVLFLTCVSLKNKKILDNLQTQQKRRNLTIKRLVTNSKVSL